MRSSLPSSLLSVWIPQVSVSRLLEPHCTVWGSTPALSVSSKPLIWCLVPGSELSKLPVLFCLLRNSLGHTEESCYIACSSALGTSRMILGSGAIQADPSPPADSTAAPCSLEGRVVAKEGKLRPGSSASLSGMHKTLLAALGCLGWPENFVSFLLCSTSSMGNSICAHVFSQVMEWISVHLLPPQSTAHLSWR